MFSDFVKLSILVEPSDLEYHTERQATSEMFSMKIGYNIIDNLLHVVIY